MYYKLQISSEGNNFMYPVPDVSKIRGAKYRKDMKECVCYYPEQISGTGIEEITETKYNQYPRCRVNLDKIQIKSDGIDTATVVVSLPGVVPGEQVNLYIDGALVDFKITDTNQATFQLTADSSMAGDILEITAESTHWHMGEKKLLEVV